MVLHPMSVKGRRHDTDTADWQGGFSNIWGIPIFLSPSSPRAHILIPWGRLRLCFVIM